MVSTMLYACMYVCMCRYDKCMRMKVCVYVISSNCRFACLFVSVWYDLNSCMCMLRQLCSDAILYYMLCKVRLWCLWTSVGYWLLFSSSLVWFSSRELCPDQPVSAHLPGDHTVLYLRWLQCPADGDHPDVSAAADHPRIPWPAHIFTSKHTYIAFDIISYGIFVCM